MAGEPVSSVAEDMVRSAFHGKEGPLHVEDMLFAHELSQRWIDSAVEWGLPFNDDFNGLCQIGAGAYQVTCRDGWRWSTADAYLKPVHDRPNPMVWANSLATEIVFDGQRACGVAYVHADVETTARADAEMILCAGAINSPQLLMLSGIGPAQQLRAHDIAVKVNLPGVGANLNDHTMTPIVWSTKDSADHQPLKANLGALRLPDSVPDDAALTEHIRRWSQTQYHPVGTCADDPTYRACPSVLSRWQALSSSSRSDWAT